MLPLDHRVHTLKRALTHADVTVSNARTRVKGACNIADKAHDDIDEAEIALNNAEIVRDTICAQLAKAKSNL